jgi:hypothetical protein
VNARKDCMDRNVNLVHNLGNGTLNQTSVSAQVQRQFGMEANAFAIKIYLVIIACHVQPHEHGTFLRIIAFAPLQKQYGLAQTVNALLVFTETTALPVQPQDTGMLKKSNACVETH